MNEILIYILLIILEILGTVYMYDPIMDSRSDRLVELFLVASFVAAVILGVIIILFAPFLPYLIN